MHNLPPNISDKELKKHLTPLVKSLNIKDWSCQKQQKKKFGSITFLYPEDGEKFQRKYGQQPSGASRLRQPRFTPHMTILDTPVYCIRNKYAPDPFLLKALLKSAEDRKEAEQ